MLQGTASHVGKTLLVLGICRSLYKKQIKVCPFKPQNITSNIYRNGNDGMIGYAQYLQAQACNIQPDVRMNPVVIEVADKKTNYIINGKLEYSGNFNAYGELVPYMKKAIIESYSSLAEEYDCIIIEGAGSPAEINRCGEDIANMWFADYFKIPIVLVGNMEYGGCFASIVGTFELLEPRFLSLIEGFLLNKYDGEESVLSKGVSYIEEKYQKKFLGSVPYLPNLKIPEEDILFPNKKVPACSAPTSKEIINSFDILAESLSAEKSPLLTFVEEEILHFVRDDKMI